MKKVLFVLLVLAAMFMLSSMSIAGYEDGCECPVCGHYHYDDYMCDNCGGCSSECSNSDCYEMSHCPECGGCFLELQFWCEDCHLCEECYLDCNMHCVDCNQCASVGTDVCDNCGACEDCWVQQGTHCLYCHECFMGEEDEKLCQTCFACEDCAGDICEYCHDCEDCATFAKENHCENCGNCYDNVGQCETGAKHCQECCIFCEQCDACLFEDGGELCEYCGLCLDCCRDNAEALDCSCGEYCVESSEWEEHTCADCNIPFCEVEQCEVCGLCKDCCASNSECSDSDPICVEDPEYEEHFCEVCGECFHSVDMCEDCYDDGILICIDCCESIKEEEGTHNATPKKAWDYNEAQHYHTCKFCEESAHFTGAEKHTFNEDGICIVCSYNNGSKSIITAHPKNVTATVTDVWTGDETSPLSDENNKISFSVTANNAKSYEWYKKEDNGKWNSVYTSWKEDSAKTNKLIISVPSDACHSNYYFKCVVIGNDGKEYESNVARLICKHAFDYRYGDVVRGKALGELHFDNGQHVTSYESQGHKIKCLGEGCEVYQSKDIVPHEFDKTPIKTWTLTDGTKMNQYNCKSCHYQYYVKVSEDPIKAKYEVKPNQKVESVTIKSIDAPKAGNQPDYLGEITDAGYAFKNYSNEVYQSGITWYDITDKKDVQVKDGKFIEGHDYKVKISLVSKPGYEFAEKVSGTISGKVGAVLIQDNQVIISLTFKATKDGFTADEKTQEQKLEESAEQKKEKTPEQNLEIIKEDLEESKEKAKTEEPAKTQEPAKSGDSITTQEQTKSEEQVKTEPQERILWTQASDWAIEELNKANELGVIPKIFSKEDLTKNITRKEFAHVAVKLYEKISGTKVTPVEKNPFTDTKDEEVLKAYNVGITLGTSDTTFDPDSLITREQMATMMTRALTKTGIDTTVDLSKVKKFDDDAEMHDWGKPSIYYMSNIEIIKGMGDGTYGVLGNATREQALLISERSAEKFAK